MFCNSSGTSLRSRAHFSRLFMKKFLFVLFGFSSICFNHALAQPLAVTNIAGQFGVSGYTNGVGLNSDFVGYPESMAADSSGNLYVLDDYSVRKIATDGTVTTFAGQATHGGYFDAPNADALFNFIDGFGGIQSDIAVDAQGNVYVAETGNFDIRKISNGMVTTLAGNPEIPGHADGTNGTATFEMPQAITLDSKGNLYVADGDINGGNPSIRKITPAGVVTTIAGGGPMAGYNNGKGTNAQFFAASGLAVDKSGTIYVADGWGVRKISPFGLVTTWVGTPPTGPSGYEEEDGFGADAWFADNAYKIVLDGSGGAYVTDGDTIRYIANDGFASVSTVAGVAGTYATNSYDGVGSDASFGNAYGIAMDAAQNIYISDASEYTISKAIRPSLLPFSTNTLVSYDTGGTPVRSSNPWEFFAYYPELVVDIKVRVQSTTTTNLESSWTDLPGNPDMTPAADGTWTLHTSNVPLGTRYFRVVASAPGYFDSVSEPVGPETILNGFAPFGNFVPQTTSPYTTGKLWSFNVTQPSSVPGMSMVVQYSGDALFWTNLPNGQMINKGSTWTLTTTNVPVGKVYFQVAASAPTYENLSSVSAGPYTITPPLPPVIQNNLSGNISLDNLIPTNADWVTSPAANQIANLFVTNLNATLTSALTTLGKEVLTITNGQTITIPGLNIGPGSGLAMKGIITGDVATILTNTLSPGEINSLVQLATTGGSIEYDMNTFKIAAAGTTNSITLLQVAILAGDLLSPAQPQVVKKSSSPKPLDLSQPSFIGQMIINGNYSQYTGTLSLGIAGTNTVADGAQQYDQLVVNGTATLAGGTILFAFFNPNDQSDTNVFQPTEGDTFDIVVASNIVVDAIQIEGPVWGDGRSFSASIVLRDDGMQALRLTAIDVPPTLHVQNSGSTFSLVYPANFAGYILQSATSPASTNWTTFSTGTNVVGMILTNSSQFFRLVKP